MTLNARTNATERRKKRVWRVWCMWVSLFDIPFVFFFSVVLNGYFSVYIYRHKIWVPSLSLSHSFSLLHTFQKQQIKHKQFNKFAHYFGFSALQTTTIARILFVFFLISCALDALLCLCYSFYWEWKIWRGWSK